MTMRPPISAVAGPHRSRSTVRRLTRLAKRPSPYPSPIFGRNIKRVESIGSRHAKSFQHKISVPAALALRNRAASRAPPNYPSSTAARPHPRSAMRDVPGPAPPMDACSRRLQLESLQSTRPMPCPSPRTPRCLAIGPALRSADAAYDCCTVHRLDLRGCLPAEGETIPHASGQRADTVRRRNGCTGVVTENPANASPRPGYAVRGHRSRMALRLCGLRLLHRAQT